VVSAFRSLETRRPQVRATNTGISAVISPTGEFSGVIGVHERGILVRGVHPRRGADTLMLAWGDWFGGFALGLGSVFLMLALIRSQRTVPATSPPPTPPVGRSRGRGRKAASEEPY
jgi:apolipoprotein N-acyltransferase